jgi:hypothetical protein
MEQLISGIPKYYLLSITLFLCSLNYSKKNNSISSNEIIKISCSSSFDTVSLKTYNGLILISIDSIIKDKNGYLFRAYNIDRKQKDTIKQFFESHFDTFGKIQRRYFFPYDSTTYEYDKKERISIVKDFKNGIQINIEKYNYYEDSLIYQTTGKDENQYLIYDIKYIYFNNKEVFFNRKKNDIYSKYIYFKVEGDNIHEYSFLQSKLYQTTYKFNFGIYGLWTNVIKISVRPDKGKFIISEKVLSEIRADDFIKRNPIEFKPIKNIIQFEYCFNQFSIDYLVLKGFYNY